MGKKPVQPGSKADHQRKRAKKGEMQERLDLVLQYLRQGYPASKIVKVLVTEYGLQERTAQRAVESAWELIGGLGSQANVQQRGLLFMRMNHLYSEVSMGENRNFDQAIQLLTLHSKLITNPKGVASHEQSPDPTRSTLSPELASIIEKLKT